MRSLVILFVLGLSGRAAAESTLDFGVGPGVRASSRYEYSPTKNFVPDPGVASALSIGKWATPRVAVLFRFGLMVTVDLAETPYGHGEARRVLALPGAAVQHWLADRLWLGYGAGLGAMLGWGRDSERADRWGKLAPMLAAELRAGYILYRTATGDGVGLALQAGLGLARDRPDHSDAYAWTPLAALLASYQTNRW